MKRAIARSCSLLLAAALPAQLAVRAEVLPVRELDLHAMPELATLPGEQSLLARGRQRAFVKVQDGCRYQCTFCVVTLARGAERSRPAAEVVDEINRIIAVVRAKVEHPFRVLKRQFGHVKTRYRGLAKNRAQLFTLFALGNLFLVRRRLLA